MTLAEFIQNNLWGLIIALISIAFQIGMRAQQLKNFVTKETLLEEYPTKDEMENKINGVFENHCPFSIDVKGFDERINKLEINKKEFNHAINNIMLALQEIKLNTKRICEKIEIKYLENS